MIKRSGALLLTLLYSVTVFGFALNLHYCGKLLASVKIDSPSESCTKLPEGKMKCCKDKQIEVKVKDEHQNASFTFISKAFVFDVPKTFAGSFVAVQQTPATKLLYTASPHAPPNSVAVFVKNCTFRI